MEALEATIIVASVDDKEHAQEMADKGFSFKMAYGFTQEESETFGAWWSEGRGGYIQPAEFLIGRGGVVLGSIYASGPVGRMGSDEAVRQIITRESTRKEQEGQAH